MKREVKFIFALLFLTCLPVTAANAVGVFSFTGGVPGSGAVNADYTLGYNFTVTADTEVLALGWYDPSTSSSPSLVDSHEVGIWDASTHVLIADVTVDNTGTLDSGFTYNDLSGPVSLPAGDYLIGGIAGLHDQYMALASSVTGSFGINYGGNALLHASGFQFPDVVTGDAGGYFGPNLKVVPIPTAVWLFGSGLVGLFGVARMKKST